MPHVPQVMAVPLSQCYMPLISPMPDHMGRWQPYFRDGKGEEPGFIGLHSAKQSEDAIVLSKGFHGNYQWDGHYAEIPLTLQELCALAHQVVEGSGLGADFIYGDNFYSLQTFVRVDKERKPLPGPGLVHIRFFQNLNGLPVVGELNQSYIRTDSQYRGPGSAMPSLDFYVQSADEFSFYANFVMAEQMRLVEDLPLAPFDKVMATLEKEIMAGRLRQVFSLNFGYTILPGPGNQRLFDASGNLFYALPTWVVDCLYMKDARQSMQTYREDDASQADIYETREFRRLIINAQTARLLDPLSKDRKRFYYAGFLSWEDVQKGNKK